LSCQPPADLLAAARAAHAHAYAPYSGFRVGAALRADDGAIVAGSNVENASFGLSRCAEQSAVQALATAGGRHFSELVVFTHAHPPASPCGACRQILFEFAPDATVYLVNDAGACETRSVADLLPLGFRLKAGEAGP
jgi:cytidine deaminase